MKKRLIMVLLLGLGLGYSVVCALAFWGQRSFIYIPPPNYSSPEAAGLSQMQEVNLSAYTTSWWIPPVSTDNEVDNQANNKIGKPVILFFHGNGSAVYSNDHIFKDFIAQGYGLLSVGYTGYPHARQDGKALIHKPTTHKPTPSPTPNQSQLLRDARRNYQFLRAENIKPEQIIFFGTSLGSAIAAQLSAEYTPALLIVDAPFNSLSDMARQTMPLLPTDWLLKDKFDSAKALQGLSMPLLWTHGTDDTIIPIAQGQKLYDSYQGPKSRHIIKGGKHTDLWQKGADNIIIAAINAL